MARLLGAFGASAAAGGRGLARTPLSCRAVPRGSAVSRGRCAVGSHRVSPEWGRGAVCVRLPSLLGAFWWLYCCGIPVPQVLLGAWQCYSKVCS